MITGEVKKNVLVTGTGGRSIGAGILYSLLYSDKKVRARWNVIAADADPFSWGLYKTDYRELLPYANHPDFIKCINLIIEKYNIDAIIPGTQVEGEILLKRKDELHSKLLIANKKELYPLMMDKLTITSVLKGLGAAYIETVPLSEWKHIAKKYGFPIIVKPTKGTGGSRGTYIIMNENELNVIINQISEDTYPCVQPYIGTGENEYTVGILTDKNGNLIDSIVMKRKLHGLSLLDTKKVDGVTASISTGYSQGYIIKDKIIQDFCEKIALELGSIGPLNIQLRVANGRIYIFEIHPRFSGTTPIRADVGFNEVDILLRNYLFNEKFSRLKYRYNVTAIRALEHVIVPMDKMLTQKF